MSHRYSILIAVTLLVLVAFAPVSMAIDSPAIDIGVTGHGKQALIITAGASGLPNGFTVRWMDESTFNAYGRTWPTAISFDEGSASFTGEPTLNTWGGQLTTFKLGPSQSAIIEIGDLFQETGVEGTTSELEYGKKYNFTSFANDENGAAASTLSATVSATTTDSENCTYTQGYWKNHPNQWPVLGLTLGSVAYTKAELLDILDESVVGNGLVSLAHQLIAAKLNIANGADPTDAAAAIAAADALIGALVVPPIGGGYLDPATTSALTQILDDYNNGVIGPGHCGSVSTEEKTWGQLKSMYR